MEIKNHNFNCSLDNIQLLAKELSLNYFNASSLDLYPKMNRDMAASKIASIKEKVYLSKKEAGKGLYIDGDYGEPQYSPDYKAATGQTTEYTRNILVIGAGCSFNSFQNIPKGKEAIENIKNKIFVSEFQEEEISLSYFLNFAERFEEEFKNYGNKDALKTIDFHALDQRLNRKNLNDYLAQRFCRDYSFMREIAHKYLSGIRKWNLINSIYSNNSDKADFETFLGTLSDIFPMDMVRSALYETYNFKHAPTLFYSIVAHLFKNRYIDVVVNFNFDELLDQAILDEMGNDGFDRIISDGDCVPISELSYGGRLRQPLYIKPHGTVSHKSSLRFTKDQYHNLPSDIRQTLIDLFSCTKENPKKRINLICVGFDMQSIEFNEIISNYLPKSSAIFFFFNNLLKDPKSTNEKVQKKTDHIAKIFSGKSNAPNIYLIGNEHFCKSEFEKAGIDNVDFPGKGLSGFSNHFGSLGNSFYYLHSLILSSFSPKFRPREIYKHLLICSIFGNRKFWNLLNGKEKQETEKSDKDWIGRSMYTTCGG